MAPPNKELSDSTLEYIGENRYFQDLGVYE